MIIVITNDLHPAIRGRMKLWFIELKPGVFISGVSNHLSKKIVDFLLKQKFGAGSLLIESRRDSPGYIIHSFGLSDRKIIKLTNLQLVSTGIKD